MALRCLDNPEGQRQIRSFGDGQHVSAHECGACVQSLERHVARHLAELASAHIDMAQPEESVEVAKHQLGDAQSSLHAVEGNCDEFSSRLDIKGQRRGVLKALLPVFVAPLKIPCH